MKLAWYWKVGIALLALAFAYFVWPGRYQYLPVGDRLVRVDRFTGQPELMQSVDAAYPLGRLIWVGAPEDDEDPFQIREHGTAADTALKRRAEKLLRAEQGAEREASP